MIGVKRAGIVAVWTAVSALGPNAAETTDPAAAQGSGRRMDRHELAAFFDKDRFWNGRDTPARYMTDKIVNPRSQRLLRELFSESGVARRAEADLLRFKANIARGLAWRWRGPEMEIPEIATPIRVDGRLDEAGWEHAALREGSYRLDGEAHVHDAARWLVAHDDAFLYVAGRFAAETVRGCREAPWEGDAFEVFFIAPGDGWTYGEVIVSPGFGITYSGLHVYGGAGRSTRKEAAYAETAGIRATAARTDTGFSAEAAIPLACLRLEDGAIRFQLVRTTSGDGGYFTPEPLLYTGHNIFGYQSGRLSGTGKTREGRSRHGD